MSQPSGKTRREFLTHAAAATAAAFTVPAWAAAQNDDNSQRPPNIVIIFTDDQGYGDVGLYGARGFKTPNLDRMARDGVRFTDFYVSQPVCSASRSSLLTGCYANRVGVAGAFGPNSTVGINEHETTIAELCKSRGYATAIFGKWHLGHLPPFLPTRHGFDEFCGIPYSNDMWPLHPDLVKLPPDAEERKRGYPDLPLYEGEKIVNPKITGEDQTQFTQMFTLRAVDFIERNRSRPFFLYVPHPMPHVPLFASSEFRGKSEQGLYGDVISEIDWSVGHILDALQRCGVADNTLVIFTTDNGPWLSYGNHAGTTGPLREGKGSTWEGGVRVPCIARWPNKIPAGTICREPAMTIDFLPTIAKLIGAPLPELNIDGLDIWPLLTGEAGANSPHDAFFFYYNSNDLEAMRAGRWKLVFPHTYRSLTGKPGADGFPDGYTNIPCDLELYDLETDIGEKHNVITDHPDVLARLQKLAEAMRDDLGDRLTKREGSGRRSIGKT